MRPQNLKTKIFLDSGDPAETRQALELLGFLDGQTTNPSLIAKNPETAGRKFSQEELLAFYEKVVKEISGLIPKGSVSIEVYADKDTVAEDMLRQAQEFNKWIPNAHIKFPTTKEGLKAAYHASAGVGARLRLNMTLVFSQQQAAAVYGATFALRKGEVFVSPFVGRLDDRGENGMDLIAHIIRMYREGNGHVEVLVASVRSLDHFMQSIKLGADIITAPLKILKEWAAIGMPVDTTNFRYQPANLQSIPYQNVSMQKYHSEYDVRHELTDKGLEKFAQDWNALLKQ